MDQKIEQVLLIIADISGYTKFMVSNRETLVHAQAIITELMHAIIKQVEIPLEIAKLEGDAVFLYAIKDPDGWDATRIKIADRLESFFNMFKLKLEELKSSVTCQCGTCQNIDKLRLKIIAHSGEALFSQIAGFTELSGVDVIAVHRLLKNNLGWDEYILMTDTAFADIPFPLKYKMLESKETYDDIGIIGTHVYVPQTPGANEKPKFGALAKIKNNMIINFVSELPWYEGKKLSYTNIEKIDSTKKA